MFVFGFPSSHSARRHVNRHVGSWLWREVVCMLERLAEGNPAWAWVDFYPPPYTVANGDSRVSRAGGGGVRTALFSPNRDTGTRVSVVRPFFISLQGAPIISRAVTALPEIPNSRVASRDDRDQRQPSPDFREPQMAIRRSRARRQSVLTFKIPQVAKSQQP